MPECGEERNWIGWRVRREFYSQDVYLRRIMTFNSIAEQHELCRCWHLQRRHLSRMQIRWHSHVHLGCGYLGCRAIFDHDWNIQWSVRHGRFPELTLGSLEASAAYSNHRHLPDLSPVRFRRSQWHHFAQRLSQCNHEPPVTFCSHSNSDFYQLIQDHGRIRQRNVRISSQFSQNHLNILPIF